MEADKAIILVDKAIELDKRMKADKKELDAIKAELQTDAFAEMDDKNLKWLQVFGSTGTFNAAYKEKFEIDDYTALINLLGEKAKAKITRKEEVKYETEKRYKEALIALYKGEYSNEITLDDVLKGMELDEKTIKMIKKKLKGDYINDKKVIESVGVQGEREEELDAIRLCKNAELVKRFFEDLTSDEIEIVRKAVFVEDNLSVGLEYEK